MAYDVARALRYAGLAVAGGFDAPVERDCMLFLLRGRQPVLVMPVRPLERFRPPATWANAVTEGRLRLESPFTAAERGSPFANARRHNAAFAERAAAILIGYGHPGGGIARLASSLLSLGAKPVYTLDLPENAPLLDAGAKPLRPDTLPKYLTAE